ncbi:MAG TPA: hypothetical protein V6C91_10185 [Coleofasciculaceae cyanobacterium]
MTLEGVDAKPGQTMQESQDILSVEGYNTAWASIIIGKCDALAGPNKDHSYYNFPNEFGNQWTIGKNKTSKCQNFFVKVIQPPQLLRREPEPAQLLQTQPTQSRTDVIQVLWVGNETTVVQTAQQNDADGRKLVVDVLLGTVSINSPKRRIPRLQAGQRYIYFIDGREDRVQDIASATNCSAVNLFLDPNNWSEEEIIRRRIDSYQPARRLCSPTQNPTQNPIPQ